MIFGSAVLSFGFILSTSSVLGFTPNMEVSRSSRLSTSLQDEGDSRRDFFSKTAGMAVVGLGCPFLPIDAANAMTGTGKVNAKLKGYALCHCLVICRESESSSYISFLLCVDLDCPLLAMFKVGFLLCWKCTARGGIASQF